MKIFEGARNARNVRAYQRQGCDISRNRSGSPPPLPWFLSKALRLVVRRSETMNEKETTTTESLLVSEVSSPTVHNQILQSMLQMAYGTTME